MAAAVPLLALWEARLDAAQALLRSGADAASTDGGSRTALHLLCLFNGGYKETKALADALITGADPRRTDADGRTSAQAVLRQGRSNDKPSPWLVVLGAGQQRWTGAPELARSRGRRLLPRRRQRRRNACDARGWNRRRPNGSGVRGDFAWLAY
jgi:hypothetical protein